MRLMFREFVGKSVFRTGSLLVTLLFGATFMAPVAVAAATDSNQDAAGAFSVVVSPPVIGIQTTPGVATSTNLKVQNLGTSTEHIKVSLMKFSAYGENGIPKLQDLQPSDDFGSWVHFSATKFDAAPQEWKTVTVTITPSKAAAFGYYYAVIFSRDNAKTLTSSKPANLVGSVASLVLLDVKAPGAKRQAQISEFSTAHKIQEFLPETFNVRMHNTGNTHVAPRGNIFITRGGKTIATLEVNLAKGYILPNSTRKFTADWADATPVYKVTTVNGKPVTHLDWSNFGLKKLRIGKYNAKLVMVYNDGEGDVAQEAKLSFWIMPWRILAVAVVILLVLVAGLWALFGAPLRRRLSQKRSHGHRS